MGDPYILKHDSNYFLYGTTSNDGFQVFESTDLENWSQPVGADEGFALRKENVWGETWFWAPEVYYYNNRFYMFYTAEEHIAVAYSDSPYGPFVQANRKPLIEYRQAIDPHLFIDADNSKYLFYVVFNNGNEIWSARLSDDLLSIVEGTEKKCFSVSQNWEKSPAPPEAAVNEGPFVIHYNGYYYLTYSANHFASVDYGVGYAVSTSPEGPWVKYRNNPILQRPEGLNGTGHHSLFEDEGQLRIVFHRHYDDIFVSPRMVHIGEVDFETSAPFLPPIIKINNINKYPIIYEK